MNKVNWKLELAAIDQIFSGSHIYVTNAWNLAWWTTSFQRQSVRSQRSIAEQINFKIVGPR